MFTFMEHPESIICAGALTAADEWRQSDLMDVAQLPFNQFTGIQHCKSRANGIFELQADGKYHNHLGTVHASALYALAEASSGQFLADQGSLNENAVLPVLRRADIKYRKAATGAIYSTVDHEDDVWERFFEALEKRRRAMVKLQVNLMDEADEQVAVAQFEWFVAMQEETR